MVFPSRALSAFSALYLLHLSAAVDWDHVNATTYLGGTCDEPIDTTFNATGSVTLPGLQLDDAAVSWTWHSGLGVEEGVLRQYFWLDTTGSDDLHSLERPYNLTMSWFTQLNSIPYEDAVDDTGNCEAALGKECVKALYAAVQGPRSDGWCCSDPFIADVPEECGRFKSDSGGHSRATWGWNRPSRNSTINDNKNKTCSTLNNSDGRNSWFASREVDYDEAGLEETFDFMAKRTYVFFASTFNTSSQGNTAYKEAWVCLTNTDFAEGSRNPSIGGVISTPYTAVIVSSVIAGLMLLR